MGGGWRAARRVAGWGTVNAHTDDRTSVGEASRVGEDAVGGGSPTSTSS